MQQPTLVGARLHLILLARELVDYCDANLGASNAVTQFRGQIPLDLLARQYPDPLEQRADAKLRAGFGESDVPRAHSVARVAFAHRHLIRALVATSRDHREPVADGPEGQQADTKLSLEAV